MFEGENIFTDSRIGFQSYFLALGGQFIGGSNRFETDRIVRKSDITAGTLDLDKQGISVLNALPEQDCKSFGIKVDIG
jgi:hypothetical protein